MRGVGGGCGRDDALEYEKGYRRGKQGPDLLTRAQRSNARVESHPTETRVACTEQSRNSPP